MLRALGFKGCAAQQLGLSGLGLQVFRALGSIRVLSLCAKGGPISQ